MADLNLATATATLAPAPSPWQITKPGPTDMTLETAVLLSSGGDIIIWTGTGTPVVGDYWQTPIVLSGSGSHSWTWSNFGTEAGDSTLLGWTPDRTIWFVYTPAEPGDFSFIPTTSGGTGDFWVWDASDISNSSTWIPIEDVTGAVDGTSVTIGAVSTGVPIVICISPHDDTDTTGQILFDLQAYQGDVEMDVMTPSLVQTPASVRVSIMGADDFDTVDFYVVGVDEPLLVDECDATGQIIGASLPVPALPSGTHTVRAVFGSGDFVEADFTVLIDPPSRPTSLPADVPPVLPVEIDGVLKWTLQDPAPGGEMWTFDINPREMDSPHAPVVVQAEHTTAPDGQAILWEAAPGAFQWSFTGYTVEQSTYDVLERFRKLGHRFWLTDHRNRAYVVTFEGIDWRPKRNIEHINWSFEYVVSLTIWRGPVAL